MHAAYAAASRLQRNDTPPSVSWNVKLALVALVGLTGTGGSITGAGGGDVSMSPDVYDAAALIPVLDPDGPTAFTSNVWEPGRSPG